MKGLRGTAMMVGFLVATSACASGAFGHGGDRTARGGQGYLGVIFRDVAEEQVSLLHLKDARGEEIMVMDHDSPACKAGLREHDVLLLMDGHAINGEEQLRRTLREMPAGRRVTFVISREGAQQSVTVQLANRETVGQEAWDRHMTVPEPAAAAQTSGQMGGRTIGFLGAGAPSAGDLSRHGLPALNSSYSGALLEVLGPQLAEYFGAQTGLLVHEVDPDSPAAAGLHAGDVVVRVDARPIASGADWMRAMRLNHGKSIAVVVLRDRREQTLTLTPDAKRRSSAAPVAWPGIPVPVEPAVGLLSPIGRFE